MMGEGAARDCKEARNCTRKTLRTICLQLKNLKHIILVQFRDVRVLKIRWGTGLADVFSKFLRLHCKRSFVSSATHSAFVVCGMSSACTRTFLMLGLELRQWDCAASGSKNLGKQWNMRRHATPAGASARARASWTHSERLKVWS